MKYSYRHLGNSALQCLGVTTSPVGALLIVLMTFNVKAIWGMSGGFDVTTRQLQKSYLQRFQHYAPAEASRSRPGADNLVDDEEKFRDALISFQRIAGINETGEADAETLRFMQMPRCAVPDNIGNGLNLKRRRRYVAQGSTLPFTRVTYNFISKQTQSRMSYGDVSSEISAAFKMWSDVTPLTFIEVPYRGVVSVQFATYAHGDGFPFDGPGGVLAHSFFPNSGPSAHFDGNESWSRLSYNGVNLRQVAAHEIGHTLGLAHTPVKTAVMAPFYQGYNPMFQLQPDDIAGIQYLYGPPDAVGAASASSGEGDQRPNNVGLPAASNSEMGQIRRQWCQNSTLDAVVVINGVTYAFKNDKYAQLLNGYFVDGFPQKISNKWPELSENIDSVLSLDALVEMVPGPYGTVPKKTMSAINYIFKGDMFWTYDDSIQLVAGPTLIRQGFPGVPSNIDASFVWGGNSKIYFIKGTQYYRFTRNVGVDSGYPRPLSSWPGVPNNIDTAFQATDQKTYFFSGPLYYRFNDISFMVDYGFPLKTAGVWFNCPTPVNMVDESTANEDTPGASHVMLGSNATANQIKPYNLENFANGTPNFYGYSCFKFVYAGLILCIIILSSN